MKQEGVPTLQEVGRSLSASVKDVAAYGTMTGLGENYVSAAAVAHGASEQFIGVIAALPYVAGAGAQILSVHLTDRLRRRRPLYLAGALIQNTSWILLMTAMFLSTPMWQVAFLAALVLYTAGVHFSSPPWNSTMGDLVPEDERGRYFAWRTSVMMMCQIVSVLAGGLWLEHFTPGLGYAKSFAIIFGAALAARAISIAYLARMTDPPYQPRQEDHFTFWQFIRATPKSNFAKFTLFVALMHFGAHSAGPFFAPFMLRHLKMSYLEYMIAINLMIAAQILFLRAWGPLSDRFGNKRILEFTGLGVSLIPFLWLFVTHSWQVFLIQVFSGWLWSGFNLSAGNFIFDAVTPAKRARCVGYYNLLVLCGVFVGGMIGTALVGIVPQTLNVLLFTIRFDSSLKTLFLISSLLRLGTCALFLPFLREVREVPSIGAFDMLFRATGIQSIAEAAGEFITQYRRRGD